MKFTIHMITFLSTLRVGVLIEGRGGAYNLDLFHFNMSKLAHWYLILCSTYFLAYLEGPLRKNHYEIVSRLIKKLPIGFVSSQRT